MKTQNRIFVEVFTECAECSLAAKSILKILFVDAIFFKYYISGYIFIFFWVLFVSALNLSLRILFALFISGIFGHCSPAISGCCDWLWKNTDDFVDRELHKAQQDSCEPSVAFFQNPNPEPVPTPVQPPQSLSKDEESALRLCTPPEVLQEIQKKKMTQKIKDLRKNALDLQQQGFALEEPRLKLEFLGLAQSSFESALKCSIEEKYPNERIRILGYLIINYFRIKRIKKELNAKEKADNENYFQELLNISPGDSKNTVVKVYYKFTVADGPINIKKFKQEIKFNLWEFLKIERNQFIQLWSEYLKAFRSRGKSGKTYIKKIFDQWRGLESHPSVSSIHFLYSKYKILARELFPLEMSNIIKIFIESNELEKALERAEIFCQLTEEGTDANLQAKILRAQVKNLLGDNEDFVLLEESLRERREQKKKIQKANARKRMAEAIRYSQLAPAQNRPLKLTTQNTTPKLTTQNTDPISRGSFLFQEKSIDAATQKEGKKERHKASQADKEHKKKAEQNKQAQAISKPSKPEKNLTPSEEKFKIRADLLEKNKERSFYDIWTSATGKTSKTLIERIEKQIVGKNFKFTEKKFKEFLTGAGCTHRINGSHQTFEFPQATYTELDGSLIFLSIDFGASYTLSPWDKEHVPLYRKKQISTALDTLKLVWILKEQNKKPPLESAGDGTSLD